MKVNLLSRWKRRTRLDSYTI